MKIIILYATTEGQTRKIARFAQRRLSEKGHLVELLSAGDARDTDISDYDGAILAASVHAGSFQTEMEDAAAAHRETLDTIRNAFLAVSLSAAGNDLDDWEGLRATIANFTEKTGWKPKKLLHVAGAFKFSEYNWFKMWAMRWIASQRDVVPKEGEDVEMTDWDGLAAFLDDFVSDRQGA